jgi:acyl carrier protein phosphodiesterase
MNFLAHLYLSGTNHELMIGNFIADMLRGKQIFEYEKGILDGIKLHKQIDEFTDEHPLVRECVELIKPSQGRYATVVVDIMFDHFLGKNWEVYHNETLSDFASYVYSVMDDNYVILPERFQKMLPKMKEQNWLYQYQYISGMEKAFEGISRRANFDSNMAFAADDFLTNYDALEQNFKEFFKDMITLVEDNGVILSK